MSLLSPPKTRPGFGRLPRLFAAVAAVGLVASACGSTHHAAGGSTATSAPGTTAAAAASTARVVLTEEANTGTSFTDNFNPFDQNSLSKEMNMRSLTYEPLLEIDFLQPSQIHDWLATGYSWSNGGTTLTFDLRHGVTWSDGQPFTSADVAFTFNLMSTNAAANYSGVPALASPPSTPDGYTVVLNFKAPAYTYFEDIAGNTLIVPEHVWSSIGSPAVSPVTNPIGTGPYVLKSFSTTLVTFTANPHYWGGTSAVSEIRIPYYASNSAAATALASGQLDWAGNDIANVQSVFVSRDPVHNHYWFASGNTVGLIFNVAKGGPLADPKVRQAISYGINRQELSTEGESGYEAPATSSSGLILPNQSQYLAAALNNDLPATPDASKVAQILTSDGYSQVGGVWKKAGQPISFSIEDPVTYSDYYADAQLIANSLKALGIEASVDGVSASQWTTDVNDGNFQSVIHWGAGGASPFVQYQNFMDYSLSAPVGQTATADFGRFNDPQAQAALQAYETTDPADTSKVDSVVQQLGQIMSTEVPVAPLLYGADWNVYSTAKLTGWPTSSNPYMDPSPNDPELPYILMQLKPA
jgi:peptide/nickel transport system substrate-binding protein